MIMTFWSICIVTKCSNHTCPCRDHQGHTWSLQQTTKSRGNLPHRQWCRKKIDDASINHNITGAVKNIDIIDDAKKEKLGWWCKYKKDWYHKNKSDIICGAKTTLHYAIRAMGAMSLRILELCLPFSPHPNISDGNVNLVHHVFCMQIFQINEKGASWAWSRWRRRRKWK